MGRKKLNFKSRPCRNRSCGRVDIDRYIYYLDPALGIGEKVVIRAGENGVTREMLDEMMLFDNCEAQTMEDDDAKRDWSLNRMMEDADVCDPLELIKAGNDDIDQLISDLSQDKRDELEVNSESSLFEDICMKTLLNLFNVYVKPQLSDEQMNLLYDYYGMNKTLEQIAQELPAKQDGSHISNQAVAKRLNVIKKNTQKSITSLLCAE